MELSQDQKEFIISNWDKLDFLSLVRQVFQNQTLDGRSKEARTVRKFLASRQLKKEIVSNQTVTLIESQKEYIKNSIDSMTPLEIGKIIFDNPKLEPLSKEVQMV